MVDIISNNGQLFYRVTSTDLGSDRQKSFGKKIILLFFLYNSFIFLHIHCHIDLKIGVSTDFATVQIRSLFTMFASCTIASNYIMSSVNLDIDQTRMVAS